MPINASNKSLENNYTYLRENIESTKQREHSNTNTNWRLNDQILAGAVWFSNVASSFKLPSHNVFAQNLYSIEIQERVNNKLTFQQAYNLAIKSHRTHQRMWRMQIDKEFRELLSD